MIRIDIESGTTICEFGVGDIAILGGDRTQSEYGIVSMKNQPAQGVGEPIHESVPDEYHHEDMDVVMTFADPRSIDVLIGQLVKAKECMAREEECSTEKP